MKTMLGVYVDPATSEALKDKATAIGSTVSALTDLFIRYGLEKMPDAALSAWAARQVSTRGRLGGALTKNERAMVAALEGLLVEDAPSWRFTGKELAASAGLRAMDAYSALRALVGRGMVKEEPSGLDRRNRFGRPIETMWSLKGKS